MASYLGVIKSYGAAKGFGFITSEQIAGDLFFLRTSLPPELKECRDFGNGGPGMNFDLKGMRVTFQLQTKPDGQQAATGIALSVTTGKPLVGLVKSYNEVKGYGFMTCSAFEGEDVFFSKSELPMPLAMMKGVQLQGQCFSFYMQQNAVGKVQAQRLKPLADQQLQMAGMQQMMFGMGGNGNGNGFMPIGKGAAKGGKGGYSGANPFSMMGGMMMPQMNPMLGWEMGFPSGKSGGKGLKFPSGSGLDGQGMVGKVKSFDTKKNYGFIASSSVSADIYFQSPEQTFSAGDQVAFYLKVMPDGKFQARDLSTPLASGQDCKGKVKSYNASKGYGFITVQGQPADVYFSKSDLPENWKPESNIVGKPVTFRVSLKTDGKPQVMSQELQIHETHGL